MKEIDPDNLENFHIPEKIISDLFEISGESESSRGFLMAFVGQDGRPIIYSKSASQVVEMFLRKSMEEYLIELEGSDSLDSLQ